LVGKGEFKKIGLGAQLIWNTFGPEEHGSIYLSGAYRIKLNSGILAIGLNAGLVTQKLNWDKIVYLDPEPLAGSTQEAENVNFNLGVHYKTDKWFLDAALSNLNKPDFTFSGWSSTKLTRQLLLSSGVNIKFSEDIIFKPTAVLKISTVYSNYVDINFNMIYKERYWAGIGRKMGRGFLFAAGIGVSKFVDIGYAYDGSPSNYSAVTGGTNEVMINILIGKRKKKDLPDSNDVMLHILDQDGNIISTVMKGEDGFFTFNELPESEVYLFKLSTDDPAILDIVNVKFTGRSGKEEIIVANYIGDQFFKYGYLPLEKTRLYMMSKDGDTLNVAFLNENGLFEFAFKDLPNDPSYLFRLERGADMDSINEVEVLFKNDREHRVVLVATKDSSSFFKYGFLPNEDAILYMISTKGDTLQVAYRNSKGEFVFYFHELPDDPNYIFKLERGADLDKIENIEVLLRDIDGNHVIIMTAKDSSSFFTYGFLPNENARMYMIAGNGDTLKIAYRNNDGVFVFYFHELPDDPNYIFKVAGSQEVIDLDNLMILLKSRSGDEEVIVANKLDGEIFTYKKLASKNMTLHILDDLGDTISSVLVNGDGFFVFHKLALNEGHMYRLENLDGTEIKETRCCSREDKLRKQYWLMMETLKSQRRNMKLHQP